MACAYSFTAFENKLVNIEEKHADPGEIRTEDDAVLAQHLQEMEWSPQQVFNVKITGEQDDLKTAGLIWKDLVVDEQERLLASFAPKADDDASLALAEQLRLEMLAEQARADAAYAASLN